VAAEPVPVTHRATPRIDPAASGSDLLRSYRRRTRCCDRDGLVESGFVDLTADGAALTEKGQTALLAADIQLDGPRRSKHVYCRPCLDWSERRPHIAGMLGVTRASAGGWLGPPPNGRRVSTSPVVTTPTHCLTRL
jgi:hypothetical protein